MDSSPKVCLAPSPNYSGDTGRFNRRKRRAQKSTSQKQQPTRSLIPIIWRVCLVAAVAMFIQNLSPTPEVGRQKKQQGQPLNPTAASVPSVAQQGSLSQMQTHTPTDRPTLSSSGGVVVSFPLKVCHIVLRGPVSPRTVPCRHVLSLFKTSRHCWLSARLVDAANVARAAAANNADGDRGGYGAVKSET